MCVKRHIIPLLYLWNIIYSFFFSPQVKLQEELKGLRFKVKDSQDRKLFVEKRIREMRNEIAANREYDDSDGIAEEEDETADRLQMLLDLQAVSEFSVNA